MQQSIKTSKYLLIMLNYFLAIILIAISSSCSSSRIPLEQQFFETTEPESYVVPPRALPPLIIIDPGHGGEDQGTLSLIKPAYQEKFLTLATANLLKDYLQKLGYRTKMTRTEDVFISLPLRSKVANDADGAFFVSVHYNSAPSRDAHGIEVFYYKSETDLKRMNASKDLATEVLGQVIAMSKAKSRGVKAGNFAVIRETKMPAILVEGGFLTNAEELEKIKDPQYLKVIAWGIAQGVDKYIKSSSL